ncbi:hypothetical protein [Ectobacillus panaciterrae]|uniref:hypothetical protein n=1 Tax=Ectobacillus panaciterrae TaxID=363872 RepID=UPI0004294820|nr:hypothetical protein [Ectobacillus panaciterrae]
MFFLKKYWKTLATIVECQLLKFYKKILQPALKKLLSSDELAAFIQLNMKQAVQEILVSEEFQELICFILKECSQSSFKGIAEELLNQEVEIITTAGTLSGVIVFVGEDYLTLQETLAVMLPFNSIISVREV